MRKMKCTIIVTLPEFGLAGVPAVGCFLVVAVLGSLPTSGMPLIFEAGVGRW